VRQIQTMDRGAEFCEVFYDEVRIPLSNIVGDVDDGWSVAMSTLAFERGTGFMAEIIDLSRTVESLLDEARTRTGPDGRRPVIADDEIARRLAEVRAEIAVLRSMTYMAISRNMRVATPGSEGSMLRLHFGECLQRVYRLAMEVLGDDALEFRPIRIRGNWTGSWLRSFASSIGGGTSEIQRNIIGDRVLGLPR
jgi:alkylation response protein AidB-like acyl-CoA dehydrogenase